MINNPDPAKFWFEHAKNKWEAQQRSKMTDNVLTEKMLENAFELLKRPREFEPIFLPPADYDLMKENNYDMTNYRKMERIPLSKTK